jgi:hypothetical protein
MGTLDLENQLLRVQVDSLVERVRALEETAEAERLYASKRDEDLSKERTALEVSHAEALDKAYKDTQRLLEIQLNDRAEMEKLYQKQLRSIEDARSEAERLLVQAHNDRQELQVAYAHLGKANFMQSSMMWVTCFDTETQLNDQRAATERAFQKLSESQVQVEQMQKEAKDKKQQV